MSPKGALSLCPRSIVHLCLRKADQKLVILKQIPVEQMSKDERLAAQNECQVLKLLSHPNVIEYYENFLEDKALMIAMEYAPGGPRSPLEQLQGTPSIQLALGPSAVASRCPPEPPQDCKRGLLEQIRLLYIFPEKHLRVLVGAKLTKSQVAERWHGLPREVPESPSLEILGSHLVVGLGNRL